MLEPILTMFAVCCRGYFPANQQPAATRKAKFGNGRRAFDFFWRLPRKTTTFAVSKTTPYSKFKV